MATMQVYRGNPEEKKYLLLSNFAGGVNTTDADGAVLLNQLRELENVELVEKGAIQNRKGFAYFKPFKEILEKLDIVGESDNITNVLAFIPLIDTSNFLGRMKDFENLKDFLLNNSSDGHLAFIMIFEMNSNTFITAFYVNIRGFDEEVQVGFENIGEIELVSDRPRDLTGIEYVNFNNRIYIPLGQIHSSLEGFLEIEVAPEYDADGNIVKLTKYREISSESYYEPNAYEITNVGFNNLAKNPINAIGRVYTQTESIRTFWLTKLNNPDLDNPFVEENLNTPIYNIPQSGEFILNVLVTGNVKPEDLTVNAWFENDEGAKEFIKPLETSEKVLASMKDKDIIRYRIRLELSHNKPVFLEVGKIIPAKPNPKYTFTSVNGGEDTSMVKTFSTRHNHYVVDSSGKFAEFKAVAEGSGYGYVTPYLEGTTSHRVKYWYKFPTTKLGENYYALAQANGMPHSEGSTLPNTQTYEEGHAFRLLVAGGYEYYRVDAIPEKTINRTYLNKVLVLDALNDENYPELVGTWQPYASFNSSTTKNVISYARVGYLLGGSNQITEAEGGITSAKLEDDFLPEPNLLDYYKAGEKYYKWAGTDFLNEDDFVEYDLSEEDVVEYNFVNLFNVGQDEDSMPIKSIKTNNVRILEHFNRLLIYENNTMWFSDYFNFAYFPNYNYVVLPLASDDKIVKIAYYRGSYIIFTMKSIYRMSGEFGTPDFQIVLINDEIGCISAKSVRNVNNSLVFLTYDGLYMLKQNYYMEGLENVEKIDSQIKGMFENYADVESILYDEKILFLLKDKNGNYEKTVKQYYNMPLSKNVFPVSVDKYKGGLTSLFKVGSLLISFKGADPYVFGKGYTDFMPPDVEGDERKNYFYRVVIKTPNYSLGYPTHNKKYKNLYVKTYTEKISPLSVTVYVDGYEYILPTYYEAKLNKNREVEYFLINDSNISMRHARLGNNPSDEFLEYAVEYNEYGEIADVTAKASEDVFLEPVYNVNDFILGEDKLGEQNYQTHKLTISGKGKSVSFKIEQEVDEMFRIHELGILHKLGKVKEG